MHCDQVWNTYECQEYPFRKSTTVPSPDFNRYNYTLDPYNPYNNNTLDQIASLEHIRWYTSPAREFAAFGSSSSAALFFTWLLIFFPLVLGPKSLIWSFFLFLPMALFLNVLLFFRAMTLPKIFEGLQYLFSSRSLIYKSPSTWERWLLATMGTWAGAQYGCLFFLGKYVGEETFVFPRLFIGGVLTLANSFLNLVKLAALASFHATLYVSEPTKSLIQSFFGCLYNTESVPVMLSQLPAARFWLFVHFLFLACTYLPFLSFTFEMVASCIAEMLPSRFADRQKFPHNLAVTAPLGLFSLALSMVSFYSKTEDFTRRLRGMWILFQPLMVAYYLVISLVILIILPLSLSKVVNLGRYEDLLSFVRQQAKPAKTSSWPIITTMFCVYVGGCLILTVPFHILAELFPGPVDIWPFTNKVILAIVIFFIAFGVVIQTTLFWANEKKYPCCVPLGRQVTVDDEPEKEVVPDPNNPYLCVYNLSDSQWSRTEKNTEKIYI